MKNQSEAVSSYELCFLPALERFFAAIIKVRGFSDALVIDPRESLSVSGYLKRHGWSAGLTLHTDQTSSIEKPMEGDELAFNNLNISVVAGPHAAGSLAFYLPEMKIIFVGEALSVSGLGRIEKEDDLLSWWQWIGYLKSLPPDVRVFAADGFAPRDSIQTRLNWPLKEARQAKRLEAFKLAHDFSNVSAKVADRDNEMDAVNPVFKSDFDSFEILFKKQRELGAKPTIRIDSAKPDQEMWLIRVPQGRPKKGLSLNKFTPERIADLDDLHLALIEADPRIFSSGDGIYHLETLRWRIEFEPSELAIKVRFYGYLASGKLPGELDPVVKALTGPFNLSVYDPASGLPAKI